METIADRLNHLKEVKGLLQQDIARENGITLRTYQRYEKGNNEPTSSTILKLSNYFGVSVDYLLGNRSDLEIDRHINKWSELLHDVITRSPDSEKVLQNFDFELLTIGMIQSFSKMDTVEALMTKEVLNQIIERKFKDKIGIIDLILARLQPLSESELEKLLHDIPNYQ